MINEDEIREWISENSEQPVPNGPLAETLKSGVVLCEMINRILANGCATSTKEGDKAAKEDNGLLQGNSKTFSSENIRNRDSSSLPKSPSKSSQGFFQMENIEYFIRKARACGVPDTENFQTIDLYEGKCMNQVFTCICSLSRNLFKNGMTSIKVIGPKLVEKVPIVFTKEQLDEAKRTISGQYGRIRPAKQ